MSIPLSKIEKLLEPTKDRSQSVSWFIGTVLGINGSQLVVEMKSGNAIYVQNFAYCNVGDEVLCMSNGTSIVAISTRNAQSIADQLNKVGLIYNAGEGITIDEDNKINADVTEADIQQLSTQIAGKANTVHEHSAADTTSGVFDLERIPTIPSSKLSGTIPNDMLPSYVDDVLEYASKSAFPATGEDGKIYVDESTNKTYRWGGSSYVEISASLALGETENTAYRGDRGKQAYDHISRSDNPHGVTYQQVGAAAEDHTHTPSEIGAAASSHTHTIANVTNLQAELNSKAETLSDLGVTATAADINKLDGVTATTAELNYVDGVTSSIQTQLNNKASSSHAHSTATTSAAGFLPTLGGGTTNFLRADGTWAKPPDTNTTYSNMSGATTSAAGKAGLVPAPSAGAATRYLRSDGTWSIPPDTNTTYSAATTSAAGLMSAADKVKLNGIATGAQVNTITGIKGNAESTYRTGNVNLTPSEIGAAASSHTHTIANVTNLQAELNSKAETLSDLGVTATAADINKLDGVTATTAELNYVDGVTSSIQTQLNNKASSSHAHSTATTSAAGFLPTLGGGTTNFLRADGTWAKPPDTNTTYSNMSGATTSAAGKAGLVPAPSAGAATRYLRSDGTWSIPPDTNTTYSAATTSAAGLMSAADKVKLNGIATGAQVNTITGIKGNAESTYRTGNVNLTPANIGAAASSHTHGVTQITGLTAGRALISNSNGNPTVSAVTSTELGYLDGVKSNVQTQLNGKAASSHTHSYKLNGSSTTNPSWYAPASAGTAGQYLVSSGNGAPTWATIEGGVVFMPNGYPEDSVYMTYDPDFNPAETFGGTWTKETQTYLFLGITIWRCVATPNQYFSPLDMHPVGTAFMTYDKAHNPAAEFGGTWTLETSTYMFLGIKIYRRVE